VKSALVSGGASFIGSHLCEALLENGFGVLCLDNLLTGSEKNISHLKSKRGFEFLEADITRPLPSRVTEKEFTHVFNLASPASPVHYQLHPIETLEANSIGTQAMLGIALKNGASFLQASTSEIYGSPAVHPQTESYWGNVNPIGLRSCYDEGKRFSEALVMSYNRSRSADTHIARIFNTYGPRMHSGDGRVIPNFITQALAGKPLIIFGSAAAVAERDILNHSISLAKLCEKTAEVLKENYGISLNIDNLIAASILHDIMHLYEYKQSKGGVEHTGLTLDHTTLGVAELYARGFPEEVIHIVAAHAGEAGLTSPRNFEALIFHHLDNLLAVTEFHLYSQKTPDLALLDDEIIKKMLEGKSENETK